MLTSGVPQSHKERPRIGITPSRSAGQAAVSSERPRRRVGRICLSRIRLARRGVMQLLCAPTAVLELTRWPSGKDASRGSVSGSGPQRRRRIRPRSRAARARRRRAGISSIRRSQKQLFQLSAGSMRQSWTSSVTDSVTITPSYYVTGRAVIRRLLTHGPGGTRKTAAADPADGFTTLRYRSGAADIGPIAGMRPVGAVVAAPFGLCRGA